MQICGEWEWGWVGFFWVRGRGFSLSDFLPERLIINSRYSKSNSKIWYLIRTILEITIVTQLQKFVYANWCSPLGEMLKSLKLNHPLPHPKKTTHSQLPLPTYLHLHRRSACPTPSTIVMEHLSWCERLLWSWLTLLILPNYPFKLPRWDTKKPNFLLPFSYFHIPNFKLFSIQYFCRFSFCIIRFALASHVPKRLV